MYSDNFKITENNNESFTLSIKLSDEMVISRRLTKKEIVDFHFKLQKNLKESGVI